MSLRQWREWADSTWAVKYAYAFLHMHRKTRLTQQHFISTVRPEKFHAIFISICIHVRLTDRSIIFPKLDTEQTLYQLNKAVLL